MTDEELDIKELFKREIVGCTFSCFGFLKQSCQQDHSGLKVCRESFAGPSDAAVESGDVKEWAGFKDIATFLVNG